jgi:hypothetical protein
MARPTSLEWGIGGEVEELTALEPLHMWPAQGEKYDEAVEQRCVVLGRYRAFLESHRREDDAWGVRLISNGLRWPKMSGTVVWLTELRGDRNKYTSSHYIESDIFKFLAGGRLNESRDRTRFYDYAIDAVIDLARATAIARRTEVEARDAAETTVGAIDGVGA